MYNDWSVTKLCNRFSYRYDLSSKIPSNEKRNSHEFFHLSAADILCLLYLSFTPMPMQQFFLTKYLIITSTVLETVTSTNNTWNFQVTDDVLCYNWDSGNFLAKKLISPVFEPIIPEALCPTNSAELSISIYTLRRSLNSSVSNRGRQDVTYFFQISFVGDILHSQYNIVNRWQRLKCLQGCILLQNGAHPIYQSPEAGSVRKIHQC